LTALDNIQGGHEALDLKTGQPITRHFVKEIPITKAVVLRVEQLTKKDGFRPHAEPIFRTCALLAGVEDNDNNNIEGNNLSDEEDSVPDILHGEESDSDSESEEEEDTFGRHINLFQEWRKIKALIPRILLQMEIPFQSHCTDQEESMCREPH